MPWRTSSARPPPARKIPNIPNGLDEQMTPSAVPPAVVRVERLIPAPPGQVYRAWLDPDLLARWMAPGSLTMARAEVEEWPGGSYRIWQEESGRDAGGFEAELLELVPHERLVFRWGFVGPERTDGPVFDSQLTITFSPDPAGGTLLTLVHEHLGELAAAMPGVAENVGPGWEAALAKLAAALAPVA
ncbi:MAG: ATPase [Actinomycetia bacterium]|nr:ATPase [Actinomycetes bacterium]